MSGRINAGRTGPLHSTIASSRIDILPTKVRIVPPIDSHGSRQSISLHQAADSSLPLVCVSAFGGSVDVCEALAAGLHLGTSHRLSVVGHRVRAVVIRFCGIGGLRQYAALCTLQTVRLSGLTHECRLLPYILHESPYHASGDGHAALNPEC